MRRIIETYLVANNKTNGKSHEKTIKFNDFCPSKAHECNPSENQIRISPKRTELPVVDGTRNAKFRRAATTSWERQGHNNEYYLLAA